MEPGEGRGQILRKECGSHCETLGFGHGLKSTVSHGLEQRPAQSNFTLRASFSAWSMYFRDIPGVAGHGHLMGWHDPAVRTVVRCRNHLEKEEL